MNSEHLSCCTPTRQYLWFFQEFPYPKVLGCIIIIICIVGAMTNLLNIIVFSTKTMTGSLNSILLSVAVCDFIVSLLYIPYLYKLYLESSFSDNSCLTFYWMVYFYLFFLVYAWMHYCSIWLTVLAAVWRYIAVLYPLKSQVWCTTRRTHIVSAIIYLICLVQGSVMLPQILVLKAMNFKEDKNGLLYNVSAESEDVTKIGTFYTYEVTLTASRGWLVNGMLVISTLFYHLIPSILLFAISIMWVYSPANTLPTLKVHVNPIGCTEYCRLWYALSRAKKVSRTLTNTLATHNDDPCRPSTNRTTKMLLSISLLCLATQVPITVVNIMNSVLIGKHFYDDCKPKLSEFYLILTTLNSAATFFIYYFMSSKFDEIFNSMCNWGGCWRRV